jgi:hypothetical protein
MPSGLNDTLLNAGSVTMQGLATHLQLYTAEPNAAGTTNVSSAGRQAITWETAANGDMVATVDMPFTGGTPNGAVTHAGFWSASSSGTFYGYAPITGDTTFNSSGEFLVTWITIAGSST